MKRAEIAAAMLPKLEQIALRHWTPEQDHALLSAIALGSWGDALALQLADVRPGVTARACIERFATLRGLCRMPQPRREGSRAD